MNFHSAHLIYYDAVVTKSLFIKIAYNYKLTSFNGQKISYF